MQLHKSMTRRETVEAQLVQRFPCIRPFEPERDYLVIQRYRNGNFGFSAAAFALYSNGTNPRGLSSNQFGLLYHDGEAIFSIGYFRKEGDPESAEGYLMISAPTGRCALEKVNALVGQVLEDSRILCRGAYVRFLGESSLYTLKGMGFRAVDTGSHPWHPRAPQEDETYSHSLLDLSKVIELAPNGFRVLRLKDPRHKSYSEKSVMHFNRFSNFLERNRLTPSMERLLPSDSGLAQSIISQHFSQLRDPVGSVAADHLGVASPGILSLPDVYAYVGRINGVPVSIFIGEKLGPGLAGLYTPFTLRSEENVLHERLGLDPDECIDNLPRLRRDEERVPRKQGFRGIAIYSQLCYFAELVRNGISHVKLGGSEKKDLDDQKRQLGAEPDPTYWAVKLRQKIDQ